jgi:hypothetical protein
MARSNPRCDGLVLRASEIGPGSSGRPEAKLTFAERKEQTAKDCEAFAGMVAEVAAAVRQGDLKAFERFFIEGGTEEGDAKVEELRERLVLRYVALHEEP